MTTVKTGDRVCMSDHWCASIGAPYEIASLRGNVVAVKVVGKKTIAKIRWDDGSDNACLIGNLKKI